MPDGIDINPEELLLLAQQHKKIAGDVAEWSKPPQEWLDNFLSSYGTIAKPVHDALLGYYDARRQAGDALRQHHLDTHDSLHKAAAAYQQTDHDGARVLNNAGNTIQNSGAASGGLPSEPTSRHTNPTAAPQHPPLVVSGGGPGGGSGGGPGSGSGGGPGGGPTGPTAPGGGPDTSAIPRSPDSHNDSGAMFVPPPAAPDLGTATSIGIVPPAGAGQIPASGPTSPEDSAPMSENAPLPFAAAVAAAAEKAAPPAYVVGGEVNGDLVLVRTLLASALAAADSPIGMAWAVCTMRGPDGAGVFITSNEGRGWLPAGLFLPRQVSTPWLWDDLLGVGEAGTPWEGISDPARILAEFGVAWGPKANAKLTALVSSGPIDPSLRAALPEVAMEGLVEPSFDVDLRVHTPGTVDRLGLAGSNAELESLAATEDTAVQSRCSELAADAHAQLARSVPASAEVAAARVLRERVLAILQAGQTVPGDMWEQLRDADGLLAAAMIALRVDVGRVELGVVRTNDEAARLRGLVFERRCNELVLALEEESTRQSLRDAVYAYDQVTGHPAFVAAPPSVSAAAAPPPVSGVRAVSAPLGAMPADGVQKAISPNEDPGTVSR
ncbi:MAG: hypothetical protein JWN03_8476 [Nocardia sp.]|uniref:type VII secretion target n=1 Tax=Nocardia sp. TaxID=1821 RepID=UPI00260E95D2|nr:type VII secretion target [Nocardia sp.]MCU1648201.1 hypothetical protein [Nocardia sp.]